MNKKILLTLAVTGSLAAGYAAKKDPVVMRVAGKDVPRSEFEYLYNKNANQQLQPQTIEEYAEMFKIYKLKVADALAEGIDTTAAFQNEFKGYQVELRQPYCVDSTYVRRLMHEAYDRMGSEIEVSHIMFRKPAGLEEPVDVYSKADSVLNLIHNGAAFEDMAVKYSQDVYSAKRGGKMGWFTALMLPYEFENVAYSMKPGEISDIVESPVGYHIIKRGQQRPARGEVLASHILLMTPQGTTAEKEAEIKARIDSIYNVAIQPGASFESLAMQYSEDKGSAMQGGKLPWFGVGRMVAEFDSVAFSIPVNTVSEPVRSQFGWHIIKKLDTRPLATYEQLEPKLEQAMSRRNDEHGYSIAAQMTENLRKKYKLKSNKKVQAKMMEYVAENGMRSDFNEYFEPMASELFMSFAGKKFTVGDFLEHMSHFRNTSFPSTAKKDLASRIQNFEQRELYREYLTNLASENPEYRNLENEYRDGMLLFEISNRKVWDKAVKDTVGLQKFFEANRQDYAWNSPRVKGVLVQAANDSVAQAVKEMMASKPIEESIPEVRKQFEKQVKVDRVLMAKGDNALVDALVFGGPSIDNPDSRYPVYFLQSFVEITEPTDVSDVRAQVTSDYQNALEVRWVEELQKKYPVIIYEKELKKIK